MAIVAVSFDRSSSKSFQQIFHPNDPSCVCDSFLSENLVTLIPSKSLVYGTAARGAFSHAGSPSSSCVVGHHNAPTHDFFDQSLSLVKVVCESHLVAIEADRERGHCARPERCEEYYPLDLAIMSRAPIELIKRISSAYSERITDISLPGAKTLNLALQHGLEVEVDDKFPSQKALPIHLVARRSKIRVDVLQLLLERKIETLLPLHCAFENDDSTNFDQAIRTILRYTEHRFDSIEWCSDFTREQS